MQITWDLVNIQILIHWVCVWEEHSGGWNAAALSSPPARWCWWAATWTTLWKAKPWIVTGSKQGIDHNTWYSFSSKEDLLSTLGMPGPLQHQRHFIYNILMWQFSFNDSFQSCHIKVLCIPKKEPDHAWDGIISMAIIICIYYHFNWPFSMHKITHRLI